MGKYAKLCLNLSEKNFALGMMVVTRLLFLSFFTLELVSSLPDCLTPDQTCQLDNSRFALPPKQVASWEECRDLCNSHIKCVSFTFYDENGSPFENMCFLFKEQCDDSLLVRCQSCVSGYQCDYCSVQGIAFSMNGHNFISMLTSYNESHCRNACNQIADCSYYTIYYNGNDLTPNTCILMSGSAQVLACDSCRTGPKICNFSATCKENEAIVMTASSPTTHALFSTNATQRVETMGCSAEANVLLVGGGGTGGYGPGYYYYYGGGGSGYINYTTIHIPYSSKYYVQVGKGGTKYVQGGQSTSIFDEMRSVILTAEGGKRGKNSNTGGNGYSGGGSAGGDGGMDGGNGNSTSGYIGGLGSGTDITTLQYLFDYFQLVPAQGNEGSNSRGFGGGGGGLQIDHYNLDDDVASMKEEAGNYSYGHGGDGYYGKCEGKQGVILFEIN